MNVLSKDYLTKEYIKKKKSISQIQKETGFDWATIKRHLKLCSILLRTHKEQASISSPGGKFVYEDVFTKKYLSEKYLKEKKGISDLAKLHKVDRETIKRYLEKNKISRRTFKEQKMINNPPKEFAINNLCLPFIDGLLLGDASIPKRKDGIKPRSLTQACKYEEYLNYIKIKLENFGISCSPLLARWINDARCKNKGYSQIFLQSHRYKTFEKFRERWYDKGIKIVPRDLTITPDLLLQTYLCDGNFYRHITLCLNAFNFEEILFLKKLLEDELKIKPTIKKQKGQFMLVIKKSESHEFLSYIGKCPVKCYEYKWKDNESEEAKERKRLNARKSYYKKKNGKS